MNKVITCNFISAMLPLLVTVSFSLTLSLPLKAQNSVGTFQNEAAVRQALLEGNWKKVHDLLGWVSESVAYSVPMLLKAHSSLALNLNNESLCAFVSIAQDSSNYFLHIDKWLKWVSTLDNPPPKGAIYYYLLGDAYARNMQWDSALTSFNAAIEISPDCYLALNARGVLYANLGHWKEAKNDFDLAMLANPGFADSYANRGTINILTKTNGKLSVDFDKALNINPDFSIALSGKGCVELFNCKFNEAETFFQQSMASSFCNAAALVNIEINHFTMLEALKDSLNALLAENAGTNIQAIQRNIDHVNRIQQNLGNSESINRGFQHGYRYAPALAESIIKRNPMPVIKVLSNDLSKAHEKAADYQRGQLENIQSMQRQNNANLDRARAASNERNGGIVFEIKDCDSILTNTFPINIFGLFY